MRLSICIPTYNRASHLVNCLNSIIICDKNLDLKFQVCISDNHSTDNTEEVVRSAQPFIDVKYHKNDSNLGIPRNFLNVVSMADGDFVWLIGDDDLIMPQAIEVLYGLIDSYPDVDFFFVNSHHLSIEYIKNYPTPFNTLNLPEDMAPYSKWKIAGELPFLKLVDPRISFDFLGGMFLSVFRKDNWLKNIGALDEKAILDSRIFSHFDNTFPHVKIFAKAFSQSMAYFNVQPLNVCLSGAREWSPMNPLVMSVRLVEALQEYRNNGLPYWQYVYCKNFALKNFASDFAKIIIYRQSSGYEYISPLKLLLSSCCYPNFYLSLFNFLGKIIHRLFVRLINSFVS
jgi:glycosyltransferase involved in cell wall biosynthesis